MLDYLILVYRNEFYNWSPKEIKKLYTKNKKPFWGLIIFIIALISFGVYSVIFRTSILMLLFILIEFIIIIIVDRLAVKQYQKYISRKQEHISKVVLLLKNTIPNNNLYGKDPIEEIINSLSNRIETSAPFNRFKISLRNFGKVIVLPIITYIAGVYTGDISKVDFTLVISWTISIIIIIGLVYIILGMFIQALQKITCRDYDAAIALREDLLDIKLLYFMNDIKQK